MSAKIYIASKDITAQIFNKQHLYLVYDADGDPSTTGDQEVIRGGPGGAPGQIEVEIGVAMASSADNYGMGEDYADRNFTELDLGALSAATVWSGMESAAAALGSVSGDYADTAIDYYLLGPNSASVITTVLYQTGYDIADTLPQIGGTGDTIPLPTFTGAHAYLGTDSTDTWDIELNYPKWVVDQGGDDTYTLDLSTSSVGAGVLSILEIGEESGSNDFVIENVDPEDVGVFRSLNGKDLIITAEGKVVGWIPDQYADEYPRLNTVTVVPTVGDPEVVDLDDPSDIPYFSPSIVPGFHSGPQGLYDVAPAQGSPLVVDLDGDGVELTSFNAASTTTFFDIDGDGFAEQTAWVMDDDGLLVRDINENGVIDDVTELFGSPSIDGFALLAQLDTNGDLVIDANDADWDDLRIWQDANSDAVSQAEEVVTLASLDIVSINLHDIAPSTSTINGNPISHTSTFKYDNGSTAAIADAWFVHDQTNAYYADSYTLDARALFLPTLRGFGELPDLHIAISENEDLLDLVADFVTAWGFDAFADPATLDDDIADILYEWAGVATVNPTSRGGNIDARHLEFLEEYFGSDFFQWGYNPNPWGQAGSVLERSFSELHAYLKAQLIVQAGGTTLFGNAAFYDLQAGELAGMLELSEDAIDGLVDYATAGGVDTEDYWVQIADFLEHTMGLSNITGTEEGWLDTAIYDSGLTTQTWDDIVDIYSVAGIAGQTIDGTAGNDTITGTSGEDTLRGQGGEDTITGGDGDDLIESGPANEYGDDELYGGDGNDTITASLGDDLLDGGNGDDELDGSDGTDELIGGAGNDDLNGGAGNDTLNPGSGSDIVEGGTGNDSYYYTSGNDQYFDNGSGSDDDTIYLPSGIDTYDLTFSRLGNNDLLIDIDGLGSIQIVNQINISNYSSFIETIEFYDTSTLDLSTIDTPTTYGTEGDDTIEGAQYGTGDEDDVIYGFGGDDLIKGWGGSDWIDGGAGNDEIWLYGPGETNIVRASAGFDLIKANTSTDIVLIPDAYSDSDVHLSRLVGSPYALQILIDGLGQIVVDSQFYTYGIEQIQFEDESPTITLASTAITTFGTSGADSINAISVGAGADNIYYSYEGNDTLLASSGNDIMYAGDGDDYVSSGGGNDEIHGGDGADTVYGGTGNDTIYGDDGNDILRGEQNDDIIYGGAGNDYLYGGSGSNQLYGGDGNDYLSVDEGNNILDGGAGDDTLIGDDYDDIFYYSSGIDTITDSWGTDTLYITGGVTVNDISFSNVSTYNTKITVTASVDELTITNQRHPTAGLHIETVIFDDGFEANLSNYTAWLNGTSGNDTIAGNGSANVLIGFAGNDDIDAGAGNDQAHGGAGNDDIHGDDGDDLLHGGDGDDVLYGDDGLDTLFGGAGADTFMFEATEAFNDIDVVKDFDVANDNDVLDISDILDATSYNHGVDLITDWVEISTSGSDSIVKVDRDGTGGTYSMTQIATLEGVTGLTDEAALVSSGNLLVA